MRRTTIFVLSVLLASGSAAFAQTGGNPSTDEIIKSLTPSGNDTATRGIRLVRPGEQPSVMPAPAPAVPAAPGTTHTAATAARPATPIAPPAVERPAVNLIVLFATDSAELTPEATATLDKLGQALSSKQLTGYRFRVEGHTDTVGTPAYNRALSQRRAEAVVSYLEQKFNIPANRLEPVGLGEGGLLVHTGDQVPEPRNRRVQVVNLGS